MKMERPILFSTRMVQALMQDRKTMTRRIMKPQPIEEWYDEKDIDINHEEPHFEYEWPTGNKKFPSECFWADSTSPEWSKYCPYGKPGDILWVRESCLFLQSHPKPGWIYKADGHENIAGDLKKEGYRWRPSIHMPKDVARIWLRIKKIKVERAQDISEKDAIKEGIPAVYPKGLFGNDNWVRPDRALGQTAKSCFEHLWISINGEESWKDNLWLWVVEFEVISKTGKPKDL